MHECPRNPKACEFQYSGRYFQEQGHGCDANIDSYRPLHTQSLQFQTQNNSQSGRAYAMIRYTHFPNHT